MQPSSLNTLCYLYMHIPFVAPYETPQQMFALQPQISTFEIREHIFSSRMALQPNLGLGLLNPPTPNISSLCRRPSPVLVFQHPLSIPVHSIYPSSSGHSNWSSPFCVSFQSFLGYPFVLHPHHITHPLVCSQSDILPNNANSFLNMRRHCPKPQC